MQTLLPGDEPPDDADPFYWYEPPTDEELYGLAPDPDCGPPHDPDAELLGTLTDDSQPDGQGSDGQGPDGQPAAEAPTTRPQVFAAGFLPRAHTGCSSSSRFGSGEVLDTLDAGTGLAGCAADAWSGGPNGATDSRPRPKCGAHLSRALMSGRLRTREGRTGPVLHADDAVANKVRALFGRAEVRD